MRYSCLSYIIASSFLSVTGRFNEGACLQIQVCGREGEGGMGPFQYPSQSRVARPIQATDEALWGVTMTHPLPVLGPLALSGLWCGRALASYRGVRGEVVTQVNCGGGPLLFTVDQGPCLSLDGLLRRWGALLTLTTGSFALRYAL